MAVPSSGQLRLRADINQEINDNDTDTNVSLGTLSDDAGFDAPDTMSEFYGYSAFTAPTITGQTNANNVSQSSMRIYFNYSNPQGNNLRSRIWFGTNSNRTSNSVYDEGTSTATSREPARTFTGLNSGTTYYAWGELSDTQSPARFTTIILNQKSQSTPLPSNPLTATKRQCTGGGTNNCTTLVAAQYNSNTTVYFDGIYDVSGSYQSGSSTMRVYASYVNGSRNDHTNSINGSGSWYAAGSYGFGACYCGWSTVLWSFSRSGYSGQGGEWCKVGAQSNLPAFLYNTC